MKVFVNQDQVDKIDPARRSMLKKLGLATAVAYAAPMLLHISAASAGNSSTNTSEGVTTNVGDTGNNTSVNNGEDVGGGGGGGGGSPGGSPS